MERSLVLAAKLRKILRSLLMGARCAVLVHVVAEYDVRI